MKAAFKFKQDLLFCIFAVGLPPDRPTHHIGEDIDGAISRDGLGHQALGLGEAGDVRDDRAGLRTRIGQLLQRFLSRFSHAFGDDDLRAFGRKSACGRPADALPRARDDTNFPLQPVAARSARIQSLDHHDFSFPSHSHQQTQIACLELRQLAPDRLTIADQRRVYLTPKIRGCSGEINSSNETR